MFIGIEIADTQAPTAGDWHRCEALRLTPRTDGTFKLEITTDLAATVRAECERL